MANPFATEFFVHEKIKSWDDIREWIIKNAGQLDYLEQYEGLDNFIGSGHYGKVWKIKGKELTIKVTTDENEIAIANVLEGQNTKAFLKIYKTINVKSNPPVQFRIQEMCYSTGLDDDFFVNYATAFIDEIKDKPYDIKDFFDFIEKKGESIKDVNVEDIQKLVNFMKNVYLDTKKLGMEEEFQYLDIHSENIMVDKDGNYKLVDF